MKRKKATRKDLEQEIFVLGMKLNQMDKFVGGIAEILNKYIEFGGKSKKFYDGLKEEIKTKDDKDILHTDKPSK